MRRVGAFACGVLACIGAATARADFEILLREGGTMIVRSYRIENDKLIAYKPSGTVEILFSRVVNVRALGADDLAPAPAKSASAKPAPVEAAAPSAPPAPRSPILTQADASARESELTRAIIIAHRDLVFAENRGETKTAIDKRKNEITRLEAERASVRKVLNGH
jgi:hypothetical protein